MGTGSNGACSNSVVNRSIEPAMLILSIKLSGCSFFFLELGLVDRPPFVADGKSENHHQ